MRTHYILGEVEEADALLKAAGGDMLFYNSELNRILNAVKEEPVQKEKVDKR